MVAGRLPVLICSGFGVIPVTCLLGCRDLFGSLPAEGGDTQLLGTVAAWLFSLLINEH